MTIADTKEVFDILTESGGAFTSFEVGQIEPGITALPSVQLSYSFEAGATQRGGKLVSQGYQYSVAPTGTVEGKELVDEQWLEAKASGDLWTPLGSLAITAETQAVELRLNVPETASTKGLFRFSLVILFGPDGPP